MAGVRVSGGEREVKAESERDRGDEGERGGGEGATEGRTKSQWRKERRWRRKASKEKSGRTGWVGGNEIEVRVGAKVRTVPFSVKAPTEIKLIGASGACRQSLRTKTTLRVPEVTRKRTEPRARVGRKPQLAVLT